MLIGTCGFVNFSGLKNLDNLIWYKTAQKDN